MLSIGEFSKICQVSVKTLHHYDKLGLLVPAQVDAETGYRYYEAAQLDRMLLIARLKRYGFSLAEICSFLDADDDAEQLTRLRQQETILQRRAQEQARTAASMEPGNMYYSALVNNLSGGAYRYNNMQQPYGSNTQGMGSFCTQLCMLNLCFNACCDGDACCCC